MSGELPWWLQLFGQLSRPTIIGLWVLLFVIGLVVIVSLTSKQTNFSLPYQDLGIAGLSLEWQNLRDNEFNELLEPLSHNANWYIVTISPDGFSDFLKTIFRAAERGVNIQWSYLRPYENDNTLRDWHVSQYVTEENTFKKDGLKKLFRQIEKDLPYFLGHLKAEIENKSSDENNIKDHIKLYESQIPTTFLALLAESTLQDDAPSSVALVNPYIMFQQKAMLHKGFGMVLKSSGKLYNHYADSIKRFFTVGIAQGYLRPVEWDEL